jgi:hypothetical protein
MIGAILTVNKSEPWFLKIAIVQAEADALRTEAVPGAPQ